MSVRLPKLTTFVRHGSFNGPDGPVTYVAQCDIVDASDSFKRYGSVTCGRGHTIDKEEQIARLWAAAPEMMEALEDAKRVIELIYPSSGYSDVPEVTLEKISAVLDKARGGGE